MGILSATDEQFFQSEVEGALRSFYPGKLQLNHGISAGDDDRGNESAWYQFINPVAVSALNGSAPPTPAVVSAKVQAALDLALPASSIAAFVESAQVLHLPARPNGFSPSREECFSIRVEIGIADK